MPEAGRKNSSLLRNFFWFGAGNGAALVLTFATQVYLARVLRPEGFGRITYALTWANYLALVADLGMSTYGVREVARSREQVGLRVQEYLSIRWFASACLFALFVAGVWLWPSERETRILLTAFALVIIARAFAVDWALQGLERMPLAGLSRAAATALPLGFFALWVGGSSDILLVPLLTFAGTLLVHGAFVTALGWFPRHPIPGPAAVKNYLRSSFSFWALTALASVQWGTADIIILNFYRGEEEVGHYGVAFKVMSVIQVVVTWLGTTSFPMLSHLREADRSGFFRERRKLLIFSLALGAILVVLGWLLAVPLIRHALGAGYEGTVPLFRVLLLLVLLAAVNGSYAQPLLAAGHESSVLLSVVFTVLVHVAACLWLIPLAGAQGAAWASVGSYSFATAYVAILYHFKMGRAHAHRGIP